MVRGRKGWRNFADGLGKGGTPVQKHEDDGNWKYLENAEAIDVLFRRSRVGAVADAIEGKAPAEEIVHEPIEQATGHIIIPHLNPSLDPARVDSLQRLDQTRRNRNCGKGKMSGRGRGSSAIQALSRTSDLKCNCSNCRYWLEVPTSPRLTFSLVHHPTRPYDSSPKSQWTFVTSAMG